ncbi:MAG: HYR domain-containing protein [Flavobacteriales bacterium]|nr:HYR domain-containing protein [Flavobacteriales bacterium]
MPTITCPGDVTVNADDAACAATGVDLGSPITADNCTVASVTNDAPASFPVGSTNVVWTVTDASGNTATCTQVVTVLDIQLPTITCPGDVTVNADDAACAATGVDLGSPITADNCNVASVTNNAPASFPVGSTNVVWTVTDASGNTATCTQVVTVLDNQLPTITCPGDVTVNADDAACAATGVDLGSPITADNCTVASVTNDAPASFPVGSTNVVWTVVDINGNSATCTQVVNVLDIQLPTITCPGDVTVNADDAACAATGVDLGSPITADNCTVASVTNNAPASFPVGSTNVVWTVTDASGNMATCTQVVTVLDIQLPTITCPGDVTVNADDAACAATGVDLGSPITADNCTVASVTSDAPASFPVGSTNVVWTVVDINGNSATCTQVVTVHDNQLPTITCPGDVTVNADDAACAATGVDLGSPITADNCTVASVTNDAPASFPVGSTNVVWTVVDINGNSATCTQVVTVLDVQLPTIICPGDVTVNADDAACAATGVDLGSPITADNCTVASVTNNAPASFPVGSTNVVWTVTDANGNVATCTQVVTVLDIQLPTITCPADVTVNADDAACAATGVDLGSPITADNCTVASVTNDAPASFPVGSTNVVWTVVDINGNSATCTQVVTVLDNQLPTITCPGDVTVNADDAACAATGVDLGSPITADNCTVASVTNDAPASFPVGSTNVVWTVVDINGNSATCTQVVTVLDNQLPTITCPGDVTVNADDAACAATGVDLGSPITADNCTVASVTNDAPASFPVGSTNVVWTVTDASGNTATCTQVVTVLDIQLPTITCPSDVTVNADDAACAATGVDLGSPITADNCNVASVTNDAPASFPVGSTNVVWTVVDINGNSATCTQVVTVLDNQLPTITCPGDVTVNADDAACAATGVDLGSPITADNCTVASVTNDAPASFPVGTTNVVWTVVDINGNSATCTQVVTVLDNQLPTITCPGDVTVNADDAACAATGVDLGSPITADNCTVASVTNDVPASFPVGSTNVVWTVTDASGNMATCTQVVTVLDIQLPTITCPGDVTVNADDAACAATGVDLGSPITADNCTVASVTNDAPASFPVGSTNVVWTVVDINGNSATCTQVVTVLDNQLPTITCPADVTVNADDAACAATGVDLGSPITADNCTVASVTNDAPASFPVGSTNVVWTVVDINGNSATCTQVVTVLDIQLPTITCPSDVTVNADVAACAATGVDLGSPITADNCTVASVTNDAPASFPVGSTNVVWTVTDASGNVATCTQVVTVTDNQLPTITCPGDVTINADDAACAATGVDLGSPITADNCTVASVTNDAPASFPVGSTNVVWTVVDINGHSATCTQVVTVLDNQLPTITCPGDLVVSPDAGSCDATNVDLGNAITSDNCSIASVTNDAPTIFPAGPTSVTWTVTDSSGNVATCTQIVTVTDDENPTITCPADVTVDADNGSCEATNVDLGTPTAADNCGSITITNDAPVSFPVGSTNVVWTVTDANGNSSTCIQVVIVLDNQLPTITCPGDVTVNADDAACAAIGVDLGSPITADNCSVASVTNDAPASFPVGSTNVVWTVVDINGNSATCTQVVTVLDVQLPTITCPADVTTTINQSNCTAINVDLGSPATDDNCGVASVTNNAPSVFPVGSTTVTWTVTDIHGNSSTCDQTVTVLDNVLPSIICPSDLNVTTDAASCVATVDLGTPVTGFSCAPLDVINDAPAQFPLGTTEVIWTVTNENGNTATCSQMVQVSDVIMPEIVCPDTLEVYSTNDQCGYPSALLAIPLTSDNCTVATVNNNAPEFIFPGTSTITWAVADGSGNTTTCEQVIIVTDTIAPTIIACNADMTVNNDAGLCGAIVNYTLPEVIDNCNITDTNLINGLASGEFFTVGIHQMTYEFVDASGNSVDCNFQIEVVDNEPSVLNCTDDINATTESDQCGAIVTYNVPTITDNCSTANGDPVMISGLASGELFPVGNTEVVYQLTDFDGAIVTCSFTVMVADTIAPEIVCNENIIVNDPELDGTIVDYELPEVIDNCGAMLNLFEGELPGGLFQHGWTQVSFEAVDTYGLVDTCSFNILVNNEPTAVDDSLNADILNPYVNINVLGNDFDVDGDSISVISASAAIGNITYQADGLIFYDADPTVFCGMDTITYVITDIYDAVDTGYVYVNVACPLELDVPEVITPNGDGVNDVLQIAGIEKYPNCHLQIFTKRGHKVFESNGFESKWDGKSQAKLTIGSGLLPQDTYYYTLDLGDGSKLMKGFIYLSY